MAFCSHSHLERRARYLKGTIPSKSSPKLKSNVSNFCIGITKKLASIITTFSTSSSWLGCRGFGRIYRPFSKKRLKNKIHILIIKKMY